VAYTTTNNIIITYGITNPTSASTQITATLYSSYLSSSENSYTIVVSTNYIIDVTYVSTGSFTKVDKAVVSMFPFYSRISSV